MLTWKRIFQELSKLNCGWDEEVPTAFAEKWTPERLNLIFNFKLMRCFKAPNSHVSSAQLHHFFDASEQGYSQLAEIDQQQQITSHWVCDWKSRSCFFKSSDNPVTAGACSCCSCCLDQHSTEEIAQLTLTVCLLDRQKLCLEIHPE